MSGGIFWVGGGGWTFMVRCGWVRLVGVMFWVGGDESIFL